MAGSQPTRGTTRVGPSIENEADDTELVALARQDQQAFAPLYQRYFDPVYRYCYRRLGSPEAAADATSLVFTKALAALPSYTDGSFRSWLFTIAHNVISNSLRDRRADLSFEEAVDLVDTAPSPEDLSLAAEEHRLLQTLLAQLSPAQRRVIELRLTGLSGPEIGRVLGLGHSNVKVTQFRAIARMRSLLGRATAPKEGHDARR